MPPSVDAPPVAEPPLPVLPPLPVVEPPLPVLPPLPAVEPPVPVVEPPLPVLPPVDAPPDPVGPPSPVVLASADPGDVSLLHAESGPHAKAHTAASSSQNLEYFMESLNGEREQRKRHSARGEDTDECVSKERVRWCGMLSHVAPDSSRCASWRWRTACRSPRGLVHGQLHRAVR